MNLTQRLKQKAYDLGFDLIGIAPAERAPHAAAYQHWLDQHYHAEMGWLERDPDRGSDPRQVVTRAKSVLVVGLCYFTLNPPDELWHDPLRGRIARYAWGLDYHDVMLPRLRTLGDFAAQEAGALNQRAYIDTGPMLERDFAAQAGLGFVGKNSLLINPRWGSYLFLGEILLDCDLDYDEPATTGGAILPQSNGKMASCGQCTRCLTACPTQAFVAPYILDSNRCISYLTIELKGTIPVDLRPLLGQWIYGCDICQEVCPWVRRYAQPNRQPFLRYDPEWAIPKLVDLMALDEAGFRARFHGSPIKRTKRRGLLRNVAVALGNSGQPEVIPILQQALHDPEPLIRDHAAWAIAQLICCVRA